MHGSTAYVTEPWDEEQVAQVCYEANRALQDVLGDSHVPPPWQVLSRADRDRYVRGVRVARSGADAEQQHSAWLVEKLAEGWRWGPKVDSEAKTHPCIKDYRDLDERQKIKDIVFIAIVTAMTKNRAVS